jgi:hypothetical protein
MKRGIAIGVACSVGIIMVGLLAFFAYRRRKQRAAKHDRLNTQEPVELDGGFWPREKAPHHKTTPIEADAQTIHELDGSTIPELPGNYEAPELNANKKTPRASYGGDDDAYGNRLKQWNDWSAVLETDPPQPTQTPARLSNPYLEVSPMKPQPTNMSPVGDAIPHTPPQHVSLSCVSPLALSPLEDAHLTSKRDSDLRRQRYYDQAGT